MLAIYIPGHAIKPHVLGHLSLLLLRSGHACTVRRDTHAIPELRSGFQKPSFWPPLWPMITGIMLVLDEPNALAA
jgi:hypothetical protein